MKKYVKPAIYCESFCLTEMIAGNCNILCNSTNGSCESNAAASGWEMGPFTQKDTACTVKLTIGTDFEGYCYWNGGKDSLTQLFVS